MGPSIERMEGKGGKDPVLPRRWGLQESAWVQEGGLHSIKQVEIGFRELVEAGLGCKIGGIASKKASEE